MAKDRFSSEVPTEPGYYWFKRGSSSEERIAQLKLFQGELKVTMCGSPYVTDINELLGCEWKGPITPGE